MDKPTTEDKDIDVRGCDYHRIIRGSLSWCDLSDNQCFVGLIDGNECDEFNDLKKGGATNGH